MLFIAISLVRRTLKNGLTEEEKQQVAAFAAKY